MNRPLILIDPGHGGEDTGSVAGNAREAAINLTVSQLLGPLLFDVGFDVYYTRHFDQTVALSTRVAISNKAIKPDLFLSLHSNAAKNTDASGIEVWTSPGQTESDSVATSIFNAIQQRNPEGIYRTDYSDGDPDKEDKFYVLRKTRCAAVLVEMGFITNWLDRVNLLSDSYCLGLAISLCAGLVDWRKNGLG